MFLKFIAQAKRAKIRSISKEKKEGNWKKTSKILQEMKKNRRVSVATNLGQKKEFSAKTHLFGRINASENRE